MKKLLTINASATLLLLLGVVSVLAAGGGGGGSGTTPPPPSCDQDTWDCDDWSVCGLDGVQTRICTLSFNCPTAETPSPGEIQDCTPLCTNDTYTCSEWTECSSDGLQHRSCILSADCPLVDEPEPIEQQICTPDCTEDTWTCNDFGKCVDGQQHRTCALTLDCVGVDTSKPNETQDCTVACTSDIYQCDEWSQCQADGRERQACQLVSDCPDAATPPPLQERICEGLRCGQLETLEERISCRLNLTDDELSEEFSILYFPEYCKVEEDLDEQRACIASYQSFGACWQLPIGQQRISCAKTAIGLGQLPDEKNNCLRGDEQEQQACVNILKEKIENLILFHLYELEIQAETLLLAGRANFNDVVAFDTFVEEHKVQIEKNDNVKAWKIIIWQVRDEWNRFKLKVI